MAEQIAIMHEAGSIPGIPGTFPGGCMVKYDDHTREVLEVKPLSFEVVEVVETPAPAPVETPQEAPAQEVPAQEAPAQDPSAPVEAPAQVEVNP